LVGLDKRPYFCGVHKVGRNSGPCPHVSIQMAGRCRSSDYLPPNSADHLGSWSKDIYSFEQAAFSFRGRYVRKVGFRLDSIGVSFYGSDESVADDPGTPQRVSDALTSR
jgi:hypothetical protein